MAPTRSLRRAPPRQAKERSTAAAASPRPAGLGARPQRPQRVTRSSTAATRPPPPPSPSPSPSPSSEHDRSPPLLGKPRATSRLARNPRSDRPPLATLGSQGVTKNRGRRHTPVGASNIHDGNAARPAAGKSAGPSSRPVTTDEPAELSPGARHLPWSELPYMILVDVFSFAAGPLDDNASVRWLVEASTTCRSFAEPALTALYQNPPLLSLAMAHGFADLLSLPPSVTMFSYRQKVRSLSIDVDSIAALTFKGQKLDVGRMVLQCYQLAELDLFRENDMPPYRALDDPLRWAYPRPLLDYLAYGNMPELTSESLPESSAENKHRLPLMRAWRWSAKMMGPELDLDQIKSIHLSHGFSSLRKITFVNFQQPSIKLKNADDSRIACVDQEHAAGFAELIEALPALSHLVLESCGVANQYLLPLLPPRLKNLELINCREVTADALADFLASHGHDLRHLTLNHNQSLNLSFLPLLGSCCPKLQTLRINLACYSEHITINSSNPLYEELLLPSQVPTWPRSIQIVEIQFMRKWTPEAAEVFFASLIDHAPNMPDLRRLCLGAMLDIPWRQRCEIRETWEMRFKRCFARKSTSPRPWKSLADVTLAHEPEVQPRRKTKRRPLAEHSGPSRRSGRISAQESGQSSRASSVARGLRRLHRGHVSYREPDSDEDMGEAPEEEQEGEDAMMGGTDLGVPSPASDISLEFVQGLCEVVDLRFDNQRPIEVQFHMDDFLDYLEGWEDRDADVDWNDDADWNDDLYT
ncbi:hypothetical protein RB597_009712 [Gaeumannomyces tritici]